MKPKLLILALMGMGIFVGLLLSLVTYYGLHKTSDQKFCVICHEMDPMVIAYKDDIHGGNGKLGASAKCVDCHLPHDNIMKYIFTKAKNGVVEGAIHVFGDPSKIDWMEKRNHREQFVFDNGCLECHGNILDATSISEQAQKMHEHYKSLLNTSQEIRCVSCHVDAGHKNMRSVLNYYQPEFEVMKEKMEQKKHEVQEKYQKFGIKKDGE